MMTSTLRVVLVVVSALVMILAIRKIRNSKVRLEDTLFWLLLALVLLVVSIFPQIFDFLSGAVGIYSTTNFVFLFFIFVLLVKCFTMGIRISQLDIRVKELAQYLAIEKYERKANDEEIIDGYEPSGKSDERIDSEFKG